MKCKGTLVVFVVALLAVFAAAADVKVVTNANNDLLVNAGKIRVGTSTGAKVTQLLGPPWRTTNYGDCHPEDYQEIWEYVGHDAAGLFRIHIEFDDDNIARIVAKVPQQGRITVLAAAPKPDKQHQH